MSFTDSTAARGPHANSSFDGRQVIAALPRAFDVDRPTQLTRRGNAGSTGRNLITQLTCGKLSVNFSTFYLLHTLRRQLASCDALRHHPLENLP
jgi:hypothetical protein